MRKPRPRKVQQQESTSSPDFLESYVSNSSTFMDSFWLSLDFKNPVDISAPSSFPSPPSLSIPLRSFSENYQPLHSFLCLSLCLAPCLLSHSLWAQNRCLVNPGHPECTGTPESPSGFEEPALLPLVLGPLYYIWSTLGRGTGSFKCPLLQLLPESLGPKLLR